MSILLSLWMAMGTAWASAPDLHLIETAPGLRTWMTETEVEQLSARNHAEGRCGGFMDVTEHEDAPDLSELAVLGVGIEPRPGGIADRPLTRGDLLSTLYKEISPDALFAHVKTLSAYPSRYYKSDTGAQAASWIRDKFVELARGRTDVTVELFQHSFAQPSVIVKIAGKGDLASEHVVLGGHEDSVNSKAGVPWAYAKAPGADDNASGIATLLETFRILMDSGYQPDRTLEFIAYAGEEGGLKGSQDVTQKYRKDGVNVIAAMQFDMTLYPGKTQVIGLVSDNVNPALQTFEKRLIDTYVQYPWREFKCGYGCSDHASWTKAGYPAVMPFESLFEEYNPNIHSDADTLDKLNAQFGTHFVKIALAFAVELGTEK